ncbi:MAG TPA: hypothetical protein VGD69_32990 [Herpetosiphonaceae bacterium]
MATIEIEVNPEVADAYISASTETQKKIQVFLNMWLPELTSASQRSLREIMDQMSDEAEARGMTDEILESILRDDE